MSSELVRETKFILNKLAGKVQRLWWSGSRPMLDTKAMRKRIDWLSWALQMVRNTYRWVHHKQKLKVSQL